jgi:hypothetical protein
MELLYAQTNLRLVGDGDYQQWVLFFVFGRVELMLQLLSYSSGWAIGLPIALRQYSGKF